MKNLATGLMLIGFSWIAAVSAADNQAIQQTLQRLSMTDAQLADSPLKGMQTVITKEGVLYISDDGKYLLQGPLFDLSGKKPVNITNQLLYKKLQGFSKQMIVYPAAKEKHVVTVFTDVTCGYCRKLHEQMKEYNQLGITVRYLAFPRKGPDSDVAKEMASVWCAKDKAKMFTIAMKNGVVPPANCAVDIAQQYQLGAQFGIQGTPGIILSDGTLLPGYIPPKQLAAMLDAQSSTD